MRLGRDLPLRPLGGDQPLGPSGREIGKDPGLERTWDWKGSGIGEDPGLERTWDWKGPASQKRPDSQKRPNSQKDLEAKKRPEAQKWSPWRFWRDFWYPPGPEKRPGAIEMGPGGWGGCFERVLEGLAEGRPEAKK